MFVCFLFYHSTLSSVLNAVALVILEDFIRPVFPNMLDQTATRLVKAVSFVFGILSFSMVFLVSHIKTILDVCIK
jgi:Na+/proline symporter